MKLVIYFIQIDVLLYNFVHGYLRCAAAAVLPIGTNCDYSMFSS